MFHELAFQIAKKAHSKQVDKAGKDYILHPMKGLYKNSWGLDTL